MERSVWRRAQYLLILPVYRVSVWLEHSAGKLKCAPVWWGRGGPNNIEVSYCVPKMDIVEYKINYFCCLLPVISPKGLYGDATKVLEGKLLFLRDYRNLDLQRTLSLWALKSTTPIYEIVSGQYFSIVDFFQEFSEVSLSVHGCQGRNSVVPSSQYSTALLLEFWVLWLFCLLDSIQYYNLILIWSN